MAATAPNGNDGMILVFGLAAIWFMTKKSQAAPMTSVARPQAGGAQPGVTPTTPTLAVNLLGQAVNRLLFPVSMANTPAPSMSLPSVDWGQSVIDSGISDSWGSLGFDIAAPDASGVPLLSGSQTSNAFNFAPDLSWGL